MNAVRQLVVANLVALTLALTACGSSQTTRYHGLEPQGRSEPAAYPYAGPVIQITAFNVPAIFDREEMLKEVSPGQFQVEEFDHWAAPFAQMARQTFATDLAARLPGGMLSPPGSPVPTGVAQLAINLEAYRVVGSHASLQVSWSYRDPNSSQGAWQTRALSLESDVGDGSGSATAAAVNQLLAQLADHIARSLGDGMTRTSSK
jgi:uncharacterized lipoprotein YmbA